MGARWTNYDTHGQMRVASRSEELQQQVLLRVLVEAAVIWQAEDKANFLRWRMLFNSPRALKPCPRQVEESNWPVGISMGDNPAQLAATWYTLAIRPAAAKTRMSDALT